MLKKTTQLPQLESSGSRTFSNVSRRRFLNYAGASAGAILVASSCQKEMRPTDKKVQVPSEGGGKDGGKAVVNLGSGDIGILNFAGC